MEVYIGIKEESIKIFNNLDKKGIFEEINSSK